MKKTILALTLALTSGAALANGGLTIDTAVEADVKLAAPQVDTSVLAQGSVEAFEAATDYRAIDVDTSKLSHGSIEAFDMNV